MDYEPPRVRATQGHTYELSSPILHRITAAEQAPVALHVTAGQTWRDIQTDGCLRRMARTHIHFATRPALARSRAPADRVWLQLDVAAALRDGVEVWQSTNGVVLVEGPLPIGYVAVVDGFPAEE